MLIKKERFRHYMKDEINYETFKRFVERPPYYYCINEKDDSDKTRLSFIDYLVNEKGFRIREYGE